MRTISLRFNLNSPDMSTTTVKRPTGTYEQPAFSFGNVLASTAGGARTQLNNPDYDKWLRDWDREDNSLRIAAAQRQSAELIVSFIGQWKVAYQGLTDELRGEVEKYVRVVATMLPRFQTLDYHKLTVTKDDSVFFQVRYGNLKAYVELHFGDDEDIELLYNLTKDKEVVSAYGGGVENTLAKLFEAVNA